MADGNYGAGVVAYRCRYYFYALDVQIVGGFVQNEHVRGIVGNHQAAEGKTHLFAATQFAARLVPHVAGKEIAVEDGFHFMFRQVAVVESFCLLEYAALITDEGVFLVQIDGGEAGTLHHSVGGVQFAHDEFQQGCFSTAVFSFQAEAVAAS